MGKATNDGFRELQRSAGRAARLLKLLANEKRLLLLCQLVGRELPVGELARRVRLFPNISASSRPIAW
jgi:DNA-binding transcriptional ArsR family regulator